MDIEDLTEPRQFNLMFETNIGPVQNENSTVYLRPETAQGIFVNFENVLRTMRAKVPFGIANIGKSFRNEITPGQFIFRTREFEQMEIEFFCKQEDQGESFPFSIHYTQMIACNRITQFNPSPEILQSITIISLIIVFQSHMK